MWWLIGCALAPADAETPIDAGSAAAAPVATSASAAPTTVATAFPVPSGYTAVDGGAFGAYLGALRVLDPAVPVRTYDGRIVDHRARVIDLPMVPGDLQQCADSAIRVRAEWQRSVGQSPSFHATSGDPLPWSRYEAGEKPYDDHGKIAWKPGSSRQWDDYLASVFMWAGTRSLAYDTTAVDDPRPGDVVVYPGSPGHAVVLLEVAKRGDDTLVLFAEGYMPAQNFHVDLGTEGGWWRWGPGLSLPYCCDLPGSSLRRWKDAG